MKTKETLENGHVVTGDNDYEFKSDGTFTNVARSRLLNGDTGKPFFTATTSESGTWTVDGDTTCWNTQNATLKEFETFTDLVTRESIEEPLRSDTPPECFKVISAGQASVVLQLATEGGIITLTRRE